MTGLRMTLQTQLVLRELIEAGTERYGLELVAGTGLPAGTIYPIMARLESAGWVESLWEDPARHEAERRPRRRYYRLTRDGADLARSALASADLARARRAAGLRLPAPGTGTVPA